MSRVLAALLAISAVAGSLHAQAGPRPSKPTPKTPGATAKPSLLNPASLKAKAPEAYKVKFTTTQGVFVVEVTRAWAPIGADRFYNLVKNGFYDGASFFRVLPGFVVQFGISAKPEVSKAWSTAVLRDDPVTQSNKRGTLSYAKSSAPNTRTTQAFINLADNTQLDGMGFSPFGEVSEGMEIVEKLYSGYGEGAPQGRGPEQGRIQQEGKAYLDRDFPQLDRIKLAEVLPPSSSTHSRAPAPKTEHEEKK